MTDLRSFFSSLPCLLNRHFSRAILDRALARGKKTKTLAVGGKRLLYVAASCLPYHISGYTSRTHEILKALQATGNDVRAVTRPGYPWDRKDSLATPLENSFERDGIVYGHSRHPTGQKQVAHYALAAAPLIERHALEIAAGRIHAASNHVNALPALLAAKRLGLPFQYEIRGLWELTRASRFPSYGGSPAFRMGLELEAYVASHADTVFALSRQLAQYAIREWHIDEKKIRLLPNCVDVERIKPFENVEVQPELVGYAGSLVSYEGLDTLLEALAILRSRKRTLKLLVIGDGEARPALEEQSRRLGLSGQVCFTGRLEPEAARLCLARAALICLPRKPFEVCKIVTPLKLVEAMALGKAVIVPDLPVFHDELGDLAQGWTFQSADAASLAEKIGEKIDQKGELARQGNLLRKHVVNTRQWKQHIQGLMD